MPAHLLLCFPLYPTSLQTCHSSVLHHPAGSLHKAPRQSTCVELTISLRAAQRSRDLGKTVADSNLRLPSLSIQLPLAKALGTPAAPQSQLQPPLVGRQAGRLTSALLSCAHADCKDRQCREHSGQHMGLLPSNSQTSGARLREAKCLTHRHAGGEGQCRLLHS